MVLCPQPLAPCLYVSALDIGLEQSFIQIAAKGHNEPNLTDAAHRTNGTFSVKVNKSTVAFGIEMMWHSADENLCILTQKSVAKRAR